MRLVVVAAGLLTVSQTQAGWLKHPKDGLDWFVIEPPARYVVAPFDGKIDVRYVTLEEIKTECRTSIGSPAEDLACSVPYPRYCIVYLPEMLDNGGRAILLRHEVAHCKGWPSDHPTE